MFLSTPILIIAFYFHFNILRKPKYFDENKRCKLWRTNHSIIESLFKRYYLSLVLGHWTECQCATVVIKHWFQLQMAPAGITTEESNLGFLVVNPWGKEWDWILYKSEEHKHCWDKHIKEEMGAECGTHGEGKFIKVWWGNMTECYHLQYKDINEKTELQQI